jgi:deoxyribodipyrimidine photolyase
MQRGHAVPERYKPFLQAVQRGKRSASARRPVGEPTVWAGASSCLPRNWTLPPVEALLAPGVFEADSLCAKGSADADEAGGEQAALQAMRRYIWEQDRLKSYVGSSDSMSPGKCNALNSTTRLSTYLAHGCLSPRRLYAEVLSYEKRRVRNRSTYWVFHEMVFRDFFAFSCIKWGARMFSAGGPLRSPVPPPCMLPSPIKLVC